MIRSRPDAWSWMWMLAVLLLAAAPHASHLPLTITALCLAVAGWWGFGVWRHGVPPTLGLFWKIAGVALTLGANFAAHEKFVAGRDPGVALLTSMLFLKLMEIKSGRDANFAMTLSYFLVTVLFFYDQSLWMGGYVLFMGMMVSIALAILTRPQGPWVHRFTPGSAARRSIRAAGAQLAQAIPLMVILFVFFPRLASPLWGLTEDAFRNASTVGLSEVMSPGSMSNLSLSSDTAFRVSFEGEPPAPLDLYWRGLVLWTFDGRNWRRPSFPLPSTPLKGEFKGPPLSYDLTREATHQPWLLTLDLPSALPSGAVLGSDGMVHWEDRVNLLPRYRAVSHVSYRADVEGGELPSSHGLQMPKWGNPRTKALARQWAERFSPAEVVNQSLLYFRKEPFAYTLSPPLLTSQHTVDEFLFTTRRGFCEHYAGAFVYLMRAAGIPARVVVGYQGGEVNRFTRHLTVRQSDAHAWAEVWLKGEGWKRVDPTAAVAPDRVERGATSILAASGSLPLFLSGDQPLIREMRFLWDMIHDRWNLWVVAYDVERQNRFMAWMGLQALAGELLGAALIIVFGLATGVIAYFMLRKGSGSGVDPLALGYAEFCRRLAAAGVTRGLAEGPSTFAERASRALPMDADAIRSLTSEYIRLRYGRGDAQQAAERLIRRMRTFRLVSRATSPK